MNPIEEIKQRLDIVDVIGESVNLHKAGRNYRALCPFHVEKEPSFYVFPDRGTWHCFGGCSTGGDVFAFVMKKENVDFTGALRLLAERAGISLGKKSRVAEETDRDRLRQANESAALFFQHALLNTQPGLRALDYLSLRGIDRQTAETFQLGYAPDSWDALREHLKGRGFGEGELLRAGLLVEGEKGLYDRFRHRAVIPIRDGQGRAVGFGSRKLPAEDGEEPTGDSESPKYLNTPQTPIFDKGAILFGLDRAAESIRRADVAVIVEGYMDVIAAHQHGNGNVVASMGTALTERQLGLLRRLTENIVLAFDPDTAGDTARDRGGGKEIAQATLARDDPQGWESVAIFRRELADHVRRIRLPPGRDPDEIIRADPEEWRRLVREAKPIHTDPAMDSFLRPIANRRKRARSAAGSSGAEAGDEKVNPGKAEEVCLALLIRYPHLRGQGLALDEELFVRTENRQVFEAWRASEPQRPLAETLAEELRPHLEQIASRDLPPFDPAQAEKALQTCAEHLKRSKIKIERAFISLEIAEKEQRLGAGRFVEQARKLMEGEAPPQDLPENDTDDARIVVREVEAGLELHERKA